MKQNIVKGYLAGLCIGLGGVANLSLDNKVIGALLFSMGLFYIIQFQLALYTGKVGYMLSSSKPQTFEVVCSSLIGNILGTMSIAGLIKLTKLWAVIAWKADNIVQAKLSDSILSNFILAVLCGFLMYCAVHNGNGCRSGGLSTQMVFGTALPVMVFMLSGYNHSIADSFYLSMSTIASQEFFNSGCYLIIVILGNAVGAFIVPIAERIMKD